MPITPRNHGPTADRVAGNIREIRHARGLDLADVSRRLQALGQPLSVDGLSKIELGQRRVDVDDLVAIAVALDVTPNRLLLPATAEDTEVQLAPNVDATEAMAWQWATGDAALPVDIWAEHEAHNLDRYRRWDAENRPHDPPDEVSVNDFIEQEEHLRPVVQAVVKASGETGWSRKATLSATEAALSWFNLAEGFARKAQEEGGDDGQHQ